MKLNREGVQLNAEERNKRNQNWATLEDEVSQFESATTDFNKTTNLLNGEITGLKAETAVQKNGLIATNKRVDNVVIEAGTAAYEKVVDASKLIWKEPVVAFSNLATAYPQPQNGWAAQTTSDGAVYRYDGSTWKKIQQVDAGPVNALDTRLTAQLAEKASQLAISKKMEFQSIRLKFTSKPTLFLFPAGFTWQNAPIKILYDGRTFKTFFDVRKFKNTGGVEYHVDHVNGQLGNTGLSKEQALPHLGSAYGKAADGDTIILHNSLYSRNVGLNISVLNVTDKSINIIAPSKCVIKLGDSHIFTKTMGYSNIWETGRSAALRVVDYPKEYEFTKMTTLADCEGSPGSWYTDGSKVYIHTLESVQPNDSEHFILINNGAFLNIQGLTKNSKVYLENLEIVGGTPSLKTINSTTNAPSVYAYGCKFMFSAHNDEDAFQPHGAKEAFLQKCVAAYSWKDGFNYKELNGKETFFIEVDCIGHSNGRFNTVVDNFNGSTAHTRCKGVRFGGVYYKNIGPNVADVSIGTKVMNFNCTAMDSASTQGTNMGFCINDEETWLFNCMAFGNDYDVYCPTGAKMNIDKHSTYYTKAGAGNLVIQA